MAVKLWKIEKETFNEAPIYEDYRDYLEEIKKLVIDKIQFRAYFLNKTTMGTEFDLIMEILEYEKAC